MARCGRCGLWSKYPADHPEREYSGACLWYQTRLREEEVYDERDCEDFFEAFPSLTPLEHFKYKVTRTDLRSGFLEAKRGKRIAYVALGLSLLGALYDTLSALF